mgnify:CR=1 FL=1
MSTGRGTKRKKSARIAAKKNDPESKKLILASKYGPAHTSPNCRSLGFFRDTHYRRSNGAVDLYFQPQTYQELTNEYPWGCIGEKEQMNMEGMVRLQLKHDAESFVTATHAFCYLKMEFCGQKAMCAWILNTGSATEVSKNCAESPHRRHMTATQKTVWDSGMRDICMRRVIRAKFDQNPRLLALLLATGKRKLVFNDTDSRYGVGRGGHGLNVLGMMLMEERGRQAAIAKKKTTKKTT